MQHAGVDEAKIIRQANKAGRPVPDAILNKPHVKMGLGLYWRAFEELSSCRQVGMQEGPIPWTAIAWWCQLNEVIGHQRRMVFRHVRQMDIAYLQFKRGKMPK